MEPQVIQEVAINENTIKNFIYVVCGQQVMLDNYLAFLYQVETGALNRAAKRNIKRFPNEQKKQTETIKTM